MDDATTTDNCGEVVITVTRLLLLALVLATTHHAAFTATDDCGNATSATQTITIVDSTAPELTIPSDLPHSRSF